MCFLIAEGYYHTSNLKKYICRIGGVAALSHVPYCLCFRQGIENFWEMTDVIIALLAGILALTIFKKKSIPEAWRFILIMACCLMAYSADWNYIAVLWVLTFGIFHGDIYKQMFCFVAIAFLYLLQPMNETR